MKLDDWCSPSSCLPRPLGSIVAFYKFAFRNRSATQGDACPDKKAQALGLHTAYTSNGTPYYTEATMAIECKMMYAVCIQRRIHQFLVKASLLGLSP